jgi:hypothetical protein
LQVVLAMAPPTAAHPTPASSRHAFFIKTGDRAAEALSFAAVVSWPTL